jgi:hypothetical protein
VALSGTSRLPGIHDLHARKAEVLDVPRHDPEVVVQRQCGQHGPALTDSASFAAADTFSAVTGTTPSPARRRQALKRVAQVGFVFFLLKGLGWLLVGFLAWKGLS